MCAGQNKAGTTDGRMECKEGKEVVPQKEEGGIAAKYTRPL